MLNERIDPNSIVGSGRVTRYLFAALSTSFIGAGLVRFAYTPLLPVLIESRWFDTSATVYLSAANPAGALFGAVTSTWLARRCSKVFILRGMNVLATLSLLACAFPISLEWYFSWRFLSGVATGATIVLVAATFLPHVPADRKGVASGLIFVGLGLGIAATRHIGPILAAIRFAGDVDLVSPFRGCFNGFNLDVLAPFGVRLEKTGVDSPSAGTVSSRLRKVSTSSRNERTNNVKVHTGSLDRN
jgi:MFS family permease